jgi:PAS domain S-box-containing protein
MNFNTHTQTEELLKKIVELEDENRDLTGLVGNSHDGLTILDGEGRFLLLNPAAERITGKSNDATLGRKIGEMSPGFDASASAKVLKTKKPQTVIVNVEDGSQMLITAVPAFDNAGKIVRIFCNIRDITELNDLKEKFENSQMLITKYLIELEEAKSRTGKSQLMVHSTQMRQIVEIAHRVARVDATVLILGESGVGKELVARLIHEASARSQTGTFVKLNCGAIPAELLESELFGYEAGAFTGASKGGKAGYFEIANNGTLLLDEIGDLPLKLQVKILSVLQDQEVMRLGGIHPKKVNVRVIAATNQDIEKMVISGTFRKDLFYRLNVLPITIPSLRERKDDIPFLIHHFLSMYNKKYDLHVRLDESAITNLCTYGWPGNVRELANLIERLVIVSKEPVVTSAHLPKKFLPTPTNGNLSAKTLRDQVEHYEFDIIRKTMAGSASLEEAAHRLGVSISTLSRRVRLMRDGEHPVNGI